MYLIMLDHIRDFTCTVEKELNDRLPGLFDHVEEIVIFQRKDQPEQLIVSLRTTSEQYDDDIQDPISYLDLEITRLFPNLNITFLIHPNQVPAINFAAFERGCEQESLVVLKNLKLNE